MLLGREQLTAFGLQITAVYPPDDLLLLVVANHELFIIDAEDPGPGLLHIDVFEAANMIPIFIEQLLLRFHPIDPHSHIVPTCSQYIGVPPPAQRIECGVFE